jgi:probable rRNA maturation factor
MKTFVQNNQHTVPIDVQAVENLAAQLANCLAAADPDTLWGDITVVLTDDLGITQPNREFFGKDRATDVISFRYDPIPAEEPAATGDLIVNVECAVREGAARDGADAELALYIAHGFDHLSGADDDTPAHRAAMRRTEKRWLASIPVRAPLVPPPSK